jgi:hypothetical protein
MRRLDFLILQAREISRTTANEDGTLPVTDNTVIQFLNDAQNRLQGLFLNLKNVQRLFFAEKDISIVAGQESYAIPDRLAFNKHIHQVMYSYSGNEEDYVRMEKQQLFNRALENSNNPLGYFIAQGKVYLTPIPNLTQAKIRVSYDRALDTLDIRRGKVTTVNGLTSTTFTSIVLDSSADETSTPNLSTIDYICINDQDGNVKAYNIPVGSYDTGTNTLTPRAGFTFVNSGDTIAANDYVTFGKYSTTHSKLPDECERYLIHYAAQSLFQIESSADVVSQNASLKDMEADIIRAYATQSAEMQLIPMLNFYEW